LVEHNPSKVRVASSSLVSRSVFKRYFEFMNELSNYCHTFVWELED
jgi:hypothetical protein